MKFNKKDLLASYEKVKVAIQKTSVIPIFSTVRFIANSGKYTLVGSNSMYQLTSVGECDGDDYFDLCFPADKLGVMLSSSKDEIEITGYDGKASSKSGKSKFNFSTYRGDDYPIISNNDGIVCDGLNIREIVGNVYSCSARNNVMVVLNGVCISSDGETIKASATDGHILASLKTDLKSNEFSIIIPYEVALILASRDSKSISINKNKSVQVLFKDGSSLISKVLDGQYPSWETLVNYDSPMHFNVDKDEFLECIKTASRVSQDGVVKLRADNNKMIIVASSYDGNYETEIDCDGDDLDVTFKTSLLISAIDVVDTDNFSLKFNNKMNKFKYDDCGVTVVIMPMRA